MRLLTLFFIYFTSIFSFNLSAQEELYHVIMTQGTIFNASSNSLLARGATIKSTDKVIFKSNDARAIMLSQTRGRFVMSPNPKAQGSELASVVKEVASPLKANTQLSTRGFNESEPIVNFKDYFGDSTFFVIGKELIFKVNTSKYPLDQKNQLVMVYEYKGDRPDFKGKVVKKTTGFEGNVVNIHKDTHFTYRDSPVNIDELESIDIYYFRDMDAENRPASKETLTSFKLVFKDEADLEEEIKTYLSFYQTEEGNMSNEKTFNLILSYVSDVYGRTDKHLLEDWLTKKSFVK